MDKDKGKKKGAPTTADVTTALAETRANAGKQANGRAGRSAEERAADEQERAAAKERRGQERAARKAERELTKKPAHMQKIASAAEKLPVLGHELRALLDALLVHPAATVQAIIAHAQHELRARLTERSLDVKLENGDLVRILSGDVKHVGQLARVTEARRIRCHVQPLGSSKRLYLLNSDVEVVSEAETGSPSVDEGAGEEPQAKTA